MHFFHFSVKQLEFHCDMSTGNEDTVSPNLTIFDKEGHDGAQNVFNNCVFNA